LRVSKTIELLTTLKTTARSLVERADKLDAELRLQIGKERQRRDAVLKDQAEQQARAREAAEAAFHTAKLAAESKFEERKTKLNRGYQAAKEKALQRVEDQTGAVKYELQKRMLQGERDRESSLTKAGAASQQFKAELASEQDSLANLEKAAQTAFRGYRKFLRLFFGAYAKSESITAPDEHTLLADLRQLLGKARQDLERFRGFVGLRLLKPIWLWVLLVLGEVPLILHQFGANEAAYWKAGEAVAGSLVVIFVLRYLLQRKAQPLAVSIAADLAKSRRLHDACLDRAEAHYQRELERIKNELSTTRQVVDEQLKKALAEGGSLRVACRMQADERAVSALEKNKQFLKARLDRAERENSETTAALKQADDSSRGSLLDASEGKEKNLTADHEAKRRVIEAEWESTVKPLYAAITEAISTTQELFPAWGGLEMENWTPPPQFSHLARFAQLDVDVPKLCEANPQDKGLLVPGPLRFGLPLCLVYPEQGSILFETAATGHDEAIGGLNNIILRLLSTAPPGRLRFTIIDPVGLGQNFAGVMHLADYEEQLINSRIWTQSGQIDEKLADLNEHMEKVIQMYLRNEYATIAEYNEQAGVIAEKYHFLVIADFPANFTENSAKRLLSIAASGAKCGVYTLIHWDRRLVMPPDFIPDELRKSSVCITCRGNDFILPGATGPGVELRLDPPPPPDLAINYIQEIGRASRDSSRVEVPFAHVAPPEAEIWSSETTSELRVPIGRTGATKFQYLAIGKGTRQHGLIAGKTGSGKSTLFHVIISNLGLWCSPEQVEFYLVDFKKGVEFKCYASRRLPHARVVAIESDREFGLSVLQRLDDELKRRGDLFRKLGVQDIPGYKRAGGTESMPRTLLLVDEFQEFFIEDDKISQTASLLLDRLVRQGRAFGIHVLLGSQTLGGAYTVARTTLGQMVIRIALQCNEADAYLIMDESNPAPRLLSRPGEGIYNDTAGTVEGNSPFQVVWLPDDVRDSYLEKIRQRADQSRAAYPGPIVFEGNAPADVKENLLLARFLEAESVKLPAEGRMWLGAPNSIKGPTEAVFQRQSGNNLLIVGQREEATLAMLTVGLISLAAQYPIGGARFIVCESAPAGTPERDYLERVVQLVAHPVTLAKQSDLPEVLSALAAEMKKRNGEGESSDAPAVFLFIHDLQRFNKLRYEEDFSFSSSDSDSAPNPAAVLNTLISEGTRLGIHVIATCDTYNNINRFLSRKAFSEFEMRVLFQMSANDSASLIDNPKAGMLGLHRALYFNAQEGYLETFRPYALPSQEWLEEAGRFLSRRAAPQMLEKL
jgi:hypothetical protein